MRTRRSPRNQEILWRELGKQGMPAPVARPEPEILTDEEIDAIPFLSKSSRSLMKRQMRHRRFRKARGF